MDDNYSCNILDKCPKCGGRVIKDVERGEVICLDCGYVLEDHIIDRGPEWRAFDYEQRLRRERTGNPVSPIKFNKGLVTEIDWRFKDSSGKYLSLEKRPQISRLRKLNKITSLSQSSEKNFLIAFAEIERMAANLGLPKQAVNEAAMLYRKAASKKLIKGRSIESMAAACIYAACRTHKVPRSLDEISEISRADKREIGRSYRLLAKEILLKIPPSKAIDFVPRLVNTLGLSQEVRMLAVKIIEEARRLRLTSGRMPKGLAAAAVYLAAILYDQKRTQREVALAAGVTEVTVRNRFKELVEKLNFYVYV
ncbi:MAG: transcription initiation factor IIB [Thermoprotei archaeon]|nr:MAG: transcription initiation factor IIB [Thermofilum sp. ex4484_79]RLE61837.1 MAG: transcription initiation factor IIB [Thermoprotei archaeon]